MSTQNRARSVRFEFRCTPDEAKIINEKVEAAQMTRTDFFVASMTEKDIVVHNGLLETLTELRREGINLNQAVRLANAGIDTQKLNRAIENCNALYEKLLAIWQNER